jgi:acetolactate synthase small subunit
VTTSHAVNVLLDGTLLTLNRAVGVLRRRNVVVERLTVHPCAGSSGASRLTFALTADAATVDRVVQQFRKIVGVRAVETTTNDHHDPNSEEQT